MASPFAALDRVSARAVETLMGEALRFLPMREGKYTAGGADPDRPARDLRGALTIDETPQRIDGDGVGANFGFDMDAGGIRVSFAKEFFTSLSDRPRKGDRIQALAREGQPIFEIARPSPDNASRIVFHCVRVTKP
jgi:hypothetical protein